MSETFTLTEINIALLLIEGKMRSEITRILHLTAMDADNYLNAMQRKIIKLGDPDPVISAAILKYKLTGREIDVLRCLLRKMTNLEMAAELFLSEETVKTHVRKVLRKLKISTRKELESWVETFMKNDD